METVLVNSFVTRQIRGSGKSYAENLSFPEIAKHGQERLAQGKFSQGYRPGVILVAVSKSLLSHFYSPIVEITEKTKLFAEVARRRPEEEPYIRIRAIGEKPQPAGSAHLILYHHDVLAETNEDETEADWELIAFNCLPKDLHNMPMGPVTMMRNQLELTGGTKGYYASEVWADSVRFWQKYAMCKDTE